ncbi:MAG: cation:proton antiporter [Acidobacteria bacterium]|nr:cation:proton antiporter [Acidobacteriota bacterium]
MHGNLTVVLEILIVAATVGVLAKRLRVHYNIALVLAGVAVGASRLVPRVGLDPEIVLQVFLPILLFEAAIATDLRRLRENLGPVVLLSVPGMLASVGVGGAILRLGLALPWALALLLGSILATTDTIAVIGTFRKVRAPGRLATIVENDSLFNDGTALVAFATILAVVQEGRFDAGQRAAQLIWVTAAGLAVGVAVGFVASLLMRRTEDHLLEIMLTVLVTYGSALLAERIHASAVLAVVAAGITVGTVGWRGLAPTGKVAIRSFWEVAAFGVNSVVFLLVGLQVEFPALVAAAPAIGWGLVAATAGRAAAIYPFLALLHLRGEPVPLRWQHLLLWGNLKGSLSMALALSLPLSLHNRDLLVAVVFGCALVTLTVQGLSLAAVARRLGLGRPGAAELRLEEEQGRLLAARAGQTELDRLQHLGLLPMGVFQKLRAAYQGVVARSERRLRDLLVLHAQEETRHVQAVRRRLLVVEKSAIRDAVNAGILSEEVAAELSAGIDRELSELPAGEGKG